MYESIDDEFYEDIVLIAKANKEGELLDTLKNSKFEELIKYNKSRKFIVLEKVWSNSELVMLDIVDITDPYAINIISLFFNKNGHYVNIQKLYASNCMISLLNKLIKAELAARN